MGIRAAVAWIDKQGPHRSGAPPRRLSLGVGSGENLNEHILGDRWPAVSDRQARLEEAIDVYVRQVGPDQEGFFDFYER